MPFHLFFYISEGSILFWDSFTLRSKGVLNQHFNLTKNLHIFAGSDGQRTGQFISYYMKWDIYFPNAVKTSLLDQVILILLAISSSLIQILFYSSIFKVTLPATCLLLLSTRQHLLSLTDHQSIFSLLFTVSLPYWAHMASEIFISHPPIKKSTPHYFFFCTILKRRGFYFRISFIKLPPLWINSRSLLSPLSTSSMFFAFKHGCWFRSLHRPCLSPASYGLTCLNSF